VAVPSLLVKSNSNCRSSSGCNDSNLSIYAPILVVPFCARIFVLPAMARMVLTGLMVIVIASFAVNE